MAFPPVHFRPASISPACWRIETNASPAPCTSPTATMRDGGAAASVAIAANAARKVAVGRTINMISTLLDEDRRFAVCGHQLVDFLLHPLASRQHGANAILVDPFSNRRGQLSFVERLDLVPELAIDALHLDGHVLVPDEGARVIDQIQIPVIVYQEIASVAILVADELVEHFHPGDLSDPFGRLGFGFHLLPRMDG